MQGQMQMPMMPQMPQGGGYGNMGLGNMFGGGQQGGMPGGPMQYGQRPQVPEDMFGPRDLGGLDYMQMGAGAAADFGNWWETRQERLGREERDAMDREERQRRRTEMGQAWRAANAGISG
jgi:hypothetical protein